MNTMDFNKKITKKVATVQIPKISMRTLMLKILKSVLRRRPIMLWVSHQSLNNLI